MGRDFEYLQDEMRELSREAAALRTIERDRLALKCTVARDDDGTPCWQWECSDIDVKEHRQPGLTRAMGIGETPVEAVENYQKARDNAEQVWWDKPENTIVEGPIRMQSAYNGGTTIGKSKPDDAEQGSRIQDVDPDRPPRAMDDAQFLRMSFRAMAEHRLRRRIGKWAADRVLAFADGWFDGRGH